MNAPKEIYIRPNEQYPGRFHWDWLSERHYETDIKYIRADLAELTWEDCACIMNAFFDFIQGIAAGRETPRHSKEELYKEVLRRYKEYKKERNVE